MSRALRVALTILPFAVLIAHVRYLSFTCDDAYISYRYADNLVRHGQLVFNLGERVEGYTNFLWTVLMAAGPAVGVPVETWASLLGLVFGCGTLWVVQRLAATIDDLAAGGRLAGAAGVERIGDRGSAPRGWCVLPAVLLAAAPPFACWCSGGLETALFTFLGTAAVWRYWREDIERSRPWSGLLFALAALTRPEGVLLFAVTAVHRVGDSLLRRGAARLGRRDAARLLLFAGPLGIHALWRLWYYGAWLPNTYYAKVEGVDFGWQGPLYLKSFAETYAPWIVVLLLVVPRPMPAGGGASPPRGAGSLYGHLFAILAVWTTHVVRVGGDFMALHRFFVPVLPLLAVILSDQLRNLHSVVLDIRRRYGNPAWNIYLVEALIAAGVLYHFGSISYDNIDGTGGSGAGIDGVRFMKQFAQDNAAIGRWLAANADASATLATTAAGAVPYYSRLRTFDMHGLTEPAVARASQLRRRPGHAKIATPEMVLAWSPTYLIDVPRVSAARPSPDGAEEAFWTAQGYVWRSVQVPELGGRWWSYFELTSPAVAP